MTDPAQDSPLGRNVKLHTQIIHFIGGYKRTIPDVIGVWENECTHLITSTGVEWIINKSNVLCVERKANEDFKK